MDNLENLGILENEKTNAPEKKNRCNPCKVCRAKFRIGYCSLFSIIGLICIIIISLAVYFAVTSFILKGFDNYTKVYYTIQFCVLIVIKILTYLN